MAGRLTTGLAGLDAQIGGGVPAGSVHVLFGEPMNALEMFSYHFAAGATQGKGGCLYITTDLEESEILDGIRQVGGRPERMKVVPLSGQRAPPAVAKGGRYILDNFTSHTEAIGFDRAFEQLKKLKQQIREAGTTALVIVVEGLLEPAERTKLRVWADGVMELGFDRQGFGLYPFLKVTKLRGVPDSARFLLFKETDKGLFMESTRRVF